VNWATGRRRRGADVEHQEEVPSARGCQSPVKPTETCRRGSYKCWTIGRCLGHRREVPIIGNDRAVGVVRPSPSNETSVPTMTVVSCVRMFAARGNTGRSSGSDQGYRSLAGADQFRRIADPSPRVHTSWPGPATVLAGVFDQYCATGVSVVVNIRRRPAVGKPGRTGCAGSCCDRFDRSSCRKAPGHASCSVVYCPR